MANSLQNDDNQDTGEPVQEARQMAAKLIEHWDHLDEEEKVGTVSEIVHQLANAESGEKTNEEEWEHHNESFEYDPPSLPGDHWSSEQTQELVDRVISRRTNWFCNRCSGQGPISSLRKARRHVESQHLSDLLKQYETPREEQQTTTDGSGCDHDIEERRENNSQLEEFEDD